MSAPEKMSVAQKLLYSKRETAQMLSLSVRSVKYLILSRQLPARRIGRRVSIHRDNIHQFAKHDHVSIRPPAGALQT